MNRRLEWLPIDRIRVGTRRQLADVTALAESQRTLGPLHPIWVREQDDGNYLLIAGNHRLEAHKLNGETQIQAFILDLEELAARLEGADPELGLTDKADLVAGLMEIDENLLHTPLIVLDRSDQLAHRQRIYEKLYPETRRGGNPGKREGKGGKNATVAFLPPTFTNDTAQKTGASQRAIQRDVQIAKKLDPEVKALLRDTPLADSTTGLQELAEMPAPQQKALVTAALAEPGGKAALTKSRLHKLENGTGPANKEHGTGKRGGKGPRSRPAPTPSEENRQLVALERPKEYSLPLNPAAAGVAINHQLPNEGEAETLIAAITRDWGPKRKSRLITFLADDLSREALRQLLEDPEAEPPDPQATVEAYWQDWRPSPLQLALFLNERLSSQERVALLPLLDQPRPVLQRDLAREREAAAPNGNQPSRP